MMMILEYILRIRHTKLKRNGSAVYFPLLLSLQKQDLFHYHDNNKKPRIKHLLFIIFLFVILTLLYTL